MNLAELHQLKALLARFYASIPEESPDYSTAKARILYLLALIDGEVEQKQLEQEKPK